MKVKKFAILAYVLVIAMLLPIGSMVVTADNDAGLAVPSYIEPYVDGAGEDNLSIAVKYDPGKEFDIIITDKRTGKEYHTNPIFQDPTLSSNTEMQKLLKSHLVLYYSFDPNGSSAALQDVGYMSSSTREAKFYSFDDCVAKEQVEIEEIHENGRLVGYKVIYGLGETKPALFPKFLMASQAEAWISQVPEDQREAFQKDFEKRYKRINIEEERAKIEREVNRLTDTAAKNQKREAMEKELADLIASIPLLLEEDGYELYPDNYSVAFKRGQMVKMWEVVGYTREDLENDYAISGYVDTTGTLSFHIPVEYRLEGNSLKATILTKEIVYPAEVAILRIDMLPSFLASGLSDEGYIFVPDGSGALIELNKVDQRSTSYQIQIMSWSKDEAYSQLNLNIRDIPYYEQAILPVFGHKTQDSGVFAIIEQGSELTNILASTSDPQTKLNLSYVSFYPTQKDLIYYSSGESSGIQMFPKLSIQEERQTIDLKTKEMITQIVTRRYCRLPDSDFVIRYNFLESDKTDYSSMANFYRNYLIQTYGLERISEDTGVPFYADIYGIIDKKVSFVGFPINIKYPLTTFEQASEIVAALQDKGIDNMKLRYMYVANGGAVQTYGNKFKVQRQLGGSKGFNEFLNKMAERNVDVFPNVDALHVFKDKMFEGFAPRKDAIETLGMTVSIIVDRNLATGVADYYREREYYHPRWAVSPGLYEKTFDGLKQGLAKYDNKRVGLGTAGTILNSDFDTDLIIDRTQTARIIANELKKLKQDGYDVIVERGNYYTLPYVSDVLNIPMTSSRFIVEDYEIPFVQMVLHGLVEYAGEPLNVTQDFNFTILKCLEYGAGVYGRYMYEDDSVFQNTYFDNFYSLDYRNWVEDTSEIYKIVNDSIGDVRNQFIVAHERLAKDVYRTTYEKGKQVVVNYSDVEYVDRDGWSVAPGSYLVFEGAN
jgi:hypothetical protein